MAKDQIAMALAAAYRAGRLAASFDLQQLPRTEIQKASAVAGPPQRPTDDGWHH